MSVKSNEISWRKSSVTGSCVEAGCVPAGFNPASASVTGSCVEAARGKGGLVLVRDSKDTDPTTGKHAGPHLHYLDEEWESSVITPLRAGLRESVFRATTAAAEGIPPKVDSDGVPQDDLWAWSRPDDPHTLYFYLAEVEAFEGGCRDGQFDLAALHGDQQLDNGIGHKVAAMG